MKLLVTGVTGFLGRHTISSLLSQPGIELICTARNIPQWLEEKNTRFIPWNLAQSPKENLYDHFERPDALLHLAWQGLPDYKNPLHETIYLEQQVNFLDALIAGGLKNITVTGTCLEYGKQEGMLNEEVRCTPVVPYARAKHRLHEHLQTHGDAIQLNWVRLFYIYGEGQFPSSLLPQLIAALERGDEAFRMSPGDQVRDFIPAEEAATILSHIVQSRTAWGTLNLCRGNPVTVKDFVLQQLDALGRMIKLETGYYPYPDYEPFQFWGDRTKLNFVLENGKEHLTR